MLSPLNFNIVLTLCQDVSEKLFRTLHDALVSLLFTLVGHENFILFF